MNIGIVCPNWIGDVVMATPTLRALRRHYGPEATIHGIMKPYVSQVLAGTDWLDELVYFDPRNRDPELGWRPVIKKLRRLKLDAMIVLTNSLRGGAIAWLSGARQRIGYAGNLRGPLLNLRLKRRRNGAAFDPVSAVDHYLHLAYAVGCPPESPKLALATLPEDERAADRIWDALGLSAANNVVLLNTGGAFGLARHWPTDYFVALAGRIVEETDASVLVICGPGEREAAAYIERRADHDRVKSMADQDMSLGVAKACVRRGQLMVTTDSGPRHFAAAFDVPAVTLFGPTDPRSTANYHGAEIALMRQLPCMPCGKRVCPLDHHRCMRELTADDVYRAVAQQLQQADSSRAA